MRRVPRLHAITDDARLADARFLDDAAAMLETGGPELALHLRGRKTTAARLNELSIALLPIARASGASLLVNDRVDVALAARVHGVQLREDSIDAGEARSLLGDGALIGASRHADSLSRPVDGADFIVFGHVFDTRSHPGVRPVGIEGLRDAVTGSRLPVIAIGGITAERIGEALAAGAYGVASLSGVWDGIDPWLRG